MKVALSALLFISSVCWGDVRFAGLVSLLAPPPIHKDNDTLDVPLGLDNVTLYPAPTITGDFTINNDYNVQYHAVDDSDDNKIVLIGSAKDKDLTITGDFTINNDNNVEYHAVVIAAGDDLVFKEGTIKNEGSNLALGSNDTILLKNVDIETGGNIAIGSLSDLLIEDTNISVGQQDNLYIYANDLISADGLVIEANVWDVYMEAQTIDLTSVTFPAESMVMLRSRDGGLNFLTNQIGNVNLSEVTHPSINDGAALTFADFAKIGTGTRYDSVSRHPSGDPYITIRSQGTIQVSVKSEDENEQASEESETENEQAPRLTITPNFKVTELGNNWYQHDQFGTFYDKGDSDWYYHLDHGWIYVDEWDDNGTWIYLPSDVAPSESYFNFRNGAYHPVTNWGKLADSTGLSLEFLRAVSLSIQDQELDLTNSGEEEIHLIVKSSPFGWVWSKSNEYPFVFNHQLEAWLLFNKSRHVSEDRFYDYILQDYISSTKIEFFEHTVKHPSDEGSWFQITHESLVEYLKHLGSEMPVVSVIPDLGNVLPSGLNKSDWSSYRTQTETKISYTDVSPIDDADFWSKFNQNVTQVNNSLKGFQAIDFNNSLITINHAGKGWEPKRSFDNNSDSHTYNNSSDNERAGASYGILDDSSQEALALEKSGLLDLENPEDTAKVDTYIEVAVVASDKFKEKLSYSNDRRSSPSLKDATTFLNDLIANFDKAVDVTFQASDLGLKDVNKVENFLEYADQLDSLLAVLSEADQIGGKNAENMDPVLSNPDKADNLIKVIDVAKDTFASSGRRNSDGDDEVTQDGKDTMIAIFRTAEKANEVAQVVASTETTSVKVLGVFKVVKAVDKAEQDKKAAEEAAAQAAEEAAAKKAAEEAAAQKAAEEYAAAIAAGNAEEIAAKKAASEAAAKKKAATDDYSEKLEAIKTASDSSSVDALLAEFTTAHDADVVAALQSDGLDLSAKADSRRAAIKAEASAAQKENVFGNLETVSDLAVASIEVEEQAAAEAAAAEAKKLASTDYQAKLAEIEAAESITDIDALVAAFNDAHSEADRDGLDLSQLADAQKEILSASESEMEAKLAAAAAAKADAEARA